MHAHGPLIDPSDLASTSLLILGEFGSTIEKASNFD